jgi:hypothetical protein
MHLSWSVTVICEPDSPGVPPASEALGGTWKHFPSRFVFLPARYTSRLALRIPLHRTIQLSYCFFLKPSEGTRILGS